MVKVMFLLERVLPLNLHFKIQVNPHIAGEEAECQGKLEEEEINSMTRCKEE
jgi:hypothetical protein